MRLGFKLMDASFGVCSDFLRCITLIYHVLVYFDARFLGLIPESNFFFFFPFVLHVLA
jgi:hypothetical protein